MSSSLRDLVLTSFVAGLAAGLALAGLTYLAALSYAEAAAARQRRPAALPPDAGTHWVPDANQVEEAAEAEDAEGDDLYSRLLRDPDAWKT